MPIYEYQCKQCGAQFDEFKTISQYTENKKSEPCQCGSTNTERVISVSAVVSDIEPYRSTITGERIRGRSHHRSHLKQHGYEEMGADTFEEAKENFHKPTKDNKEDRVEDVKRAYEALR